MSLTRNLLLFTACLLAVTVSWADAIIQTRAMSASTIVEYYIDDAGVRVEMEIGLQDMQAFGNLRSRGSGLEMQHSYISL